MQVWLKGYIASYEDVVRNTVVSPSGAHVAKVFGNFAYNDFTIDDGMNVFTGRTLHEALQAFVEHIEQ